LLDLAGSHFGAQAFGREGDAADGFGLMAQDRVFEVGVDVYVDDGLLRLGGGVLAGRCQQGSGQGGGGGPADGLLQEFAPGEAGCG
jgi:hypothetical protein